MPGLTLDMVKTFVMGSLGHPVVKVELDDSQISTALDQSLYYVSYNRPREVRVPFAVGAGQQAFTIPNYGYDVVDVEVPPPENILTAEFDMFNPMLVTHPISLSDYHLTRMYAETAKKVLSADFDWEFNKETGEVLINPIPNKSYIAIAVCHYPVLVETVTDPNIQKWVKEFTLAKCKQILGIIRRKVGRIEGTEVTLELDGNELITEGKEEEKTLLMKLEERSGDFVPPMIGGF